MIDLNLFMKNHSIILIDSNLDLFWANFSYIFGQKNNWISHCFAETKPLNKLSYQNWVRSCYRSEVEMEVLTLNHIFELWKKHNF